MKVETVTSAKRFASKHCTVCGKVVDLKQKVVTVTIPNFGFSFTHKDCAHGILGPSDQEVMDEWREIRLTLKENNGIRIEG
jgi:hypothetical protein